MENRESEECLNTTSTFQNHVREAWGNPNEVASAGFVEMCRQQHMRPYDFYWGTDRQIRYAQEIGVLAGIMKDSTPEAFISVFESDFLNH